MYFKLLRPLGTLVLCGLPEDKLPAFFAQELVGKNLSLAGSLIGSTDELREMLALAAEKNIRPWIKVRPLSEASQAVKDTENGLARCEYFSFFFCGSFEVGNGGEGEPEFADLAPFSFADRYVLEV